MQPAMTQTRGTPLVGKYPAAVALALLALCPFIVLSTATLLIPQQLTISLHTTTFGVNLSEALSNAAYAFGAVVAADLILRVPKWATYVACEAGFVVGSLLCVAAPGVIAFTVGRTVQGMATGMLLVVALPPLVTAHGVRRLPLTAAFVNLGLFGMVTLGPVVGGLAGSYFDWRWLFAAVAVAGVTGLVVGLLGFERTAAASPGIGFDKSAIPVAACATTLPFLGVAWLSRGPVTSVGFVLPFVIGLAALALLLVRQYRKDEALMPMRLIMHTLPVTGVGAAMVAGAGFTTLIELAATYLLRARHDPPGLVGGLLATQMAGIVVAAWMFKRVLTTRWLPALTFAGLGLVAVGGGVLLLLGSGFDAATVAIAGLLLGFGAGAGVAPGLFMGGLSVPSNRLGPTFALVELLRSEAAFMVAPVLMYVALLAPHLLSGVRLAAFVTTAFVVVSWLVLLGLLLLGGTRPHAPDLAGWIDGDSPAYHSPPLAGAVRDT